VGILGSLLAACGMGGRSDVDAVAAALRDAVEALPEHLDGEVRFQDSANAGTFVSGVLVLAGQEREAVETSLLRVLQTVDLVYREQARVRTAFVRIEAHPAGDRGLRVLATDVIPAGSAANITTDDLTAFFEE